MNGQKSETEKQGIQHFSSSLAQTPFPVREAVDWDDPELGRWVIDHIGIDHKGCLPNRESTSKSDSSNVRSPSTIAEEQVDSFTMA